MKQRTLEAAGVRPKDSIVPYWLHDVGKPRIFLYSAIALLILGSAVWFIANNRTGDLPIGSSNSDSQQVANSTVREDESKVKIKVGETGSAFNDEVKITVSKIQLDKVSSKYKVSANVIFPGDERVGIIDAEVNYKLSYPKEAAFEIEVLDIQESMAFFSIRKVRKINGQP